MLNKIGENDHHYLVNIRGALNLSVLNVTLTKFFYIGFMSLRKFVSVPCLLTILCSEAFYVSAKMIIGVFLFW